MDVKIGFLYGELEETIDMKEPDAFMVDGKSNWVCKMKKSL